VVDDGCREDVDMLVRNEIDTLDPRRLAAREQDLTRDLLSLICRTTGRRRRPDECRHLDALVSEIHAVRHARRDASRLS
jgi:hypothetical protein